MKSSTLSLLFLLTAVPLVAAEDGQGIAFFEKKIRPVLIKHCYECHSAASTEIKGEFRLDSRDGIRKGGETGPAVVPGDLDKSLLLEALRHESLEMPPKKKLPAAVINDFEQWIRIGAPDPRDRPPTASQAAEISWQATLAARRDWWSLRPVQKVEPPFSNRSEHTVDRFLLAKLEAQGLKPSHPADRRTLIRRLSLVLTGLPPTVPQIERFLSDRSPKAYEQLVDRLLASPHFGERFARHWMDVVRFTETHGNEWNYEVHHAWRYRDYLIRALNNDVPYDQLIREHIAGDLLSQPRLNKQQQINESVIGTAAYRFGEVNHDDCIGLPSIGFDLADNRIDTLTKAFQATTVACARCHDHKIDAVSTKDYYALLGILRSSRLVAHTIDAPEVNAKPLGRMAQLKVKIRQELSRLWKADVPQISLYMQLGDSVCHEGSLPLPLPQWCDRQRLEKWVEALKVRNSKFDHPLSLWLAMGPPGSDKPVPWEPFKKRYLTRQSTRKKLNGERFVSLADFRTGKIDPWKATGQGLRQGSSSSGDFSVAPEGDRAVHSILPSGCVTHGLSQKLNGALRSPILNSDRKRISFRVLGGKTSAVRLVSNNCQLNYKNYCALISNKLTWITFSLPERAGPIRVYAEIMTKFDNPKFPDQLGTLGGDTKNDRIPWEQAAADPYSYFGITQVVLHDIDEPPKTDLTHLCRLFREDFATKEVSKADVAKRYAQVIHQAINNWGDHRADDADVLWLNWLVQNDLIANTANQSPKLAKLIADFRQIESEELIQPRIIPGLADFGSGFEQPVFVGGDCMKPGEPVERRYLEVLARNVDKFNCQGSGRLELADRIASKSNPLTARVMVNRIWHHLFGAGIVRTVDDFGQVGELPSHPKLLDHLASQFVAEGWSIKKLIRTLVTTQTFQQGGLASPESKRVDPQNRLLSFYPARRMNAEAVRDSILATSGRLDRKLHGMSIAPYRKEANDVRRLFPGPLDGDGRRSLYIKVTLMEGPKFLTAFNFPGSKVTQGRRDVTNVPTQALALLNDPFVNQQASVWGNRLVQSSHASIDQRIEEMFMQALGRPPREQERTEFNRLVRKLAELHGVESENVLTDVTLWKDAAHVIFNLKEFIYIP